MKNLKLFLFLLSAIALLASCGGDGSPEREIINLDEYIVLNTNTLGRQVAENIPTTPPDTILEVAKRPKPEIIRNDQGQVTERRQYSFKRDGAPREYNVFQYEYDEQGSRIREITEMYTADGQYKGKIYNVFRYDDEGKKSVFIFRSYDKNGSLIRMFCSLYDYNDDGLEIQAKTFNSEGELISRVDRFRNDRGEITKEKFLEYNQNGEIINDDILHYDKNGTVIKQE